MQWQSRFGEHLPPALLAEVAQRILSGKRVYILLAAEVEIL